MRSSRYPFVDWEPYFAPWEDAEPDREGLVWLYDAEGTPILKCDPASAPVIAAALEYAHADVQEIYGVGYGNLIDEQVVRILNRHNGEHPHVGMRSVAPDCPHQKEMSGPGLTGAEEILDVCSCGAHLILRPGSSEPEWHV